MFQGILLLMLSMLAESVYIKIDPNPTKVYITSNTTLTILVHNDDDSLYSSNIAGTLSSSNGCADLSISKFDKNSVLATANFTKIGECQIIASIDDLNIQKTLKLNVDRIKFNFTRNPSISNTTSNDSLSYEISAIGQDNKILTYFYGSAFLNLKCLTIECSGDIFKIIEEDGIHEVKKFQIDFKDGYFSTDNLFILSSGKFKLQASSDISETGESKEIQVQNYLKEIKITVDENPQSALKDLNINVRLLGDDGEEYIQPTIASLETNFSSYNGDTNYTTSTGTWNITCYFNLSGNFSLKVTTNESDSVEGNLEKLKIYPNLLKFSEFSEDLPTNDRHTFGYTVRVYDSSGDSVIKKPQVEVRSFVDKDHSLGGKSKVLTVDGVAKFKDINFEDSGKQKLRVTIGDQVFVYEKSFDIESTDCSVGSGPISCTSVLIFLGLFLPFVFYNSDKSITSFPKKPLFLLIHPLTGLFFESPRNRRLSLSILLVTCELITITLIGAVYAYFDDPTEHYDKDFTDYYGRILYKGGMGWAIGQFAIIPLFFLNFFSVGNRKLAIYFYVICGIFIILCFGAMIGMTAKYCIGYSQYWTVNFLIFLLFDLVLMEVIYVIIAILIMSEKHKRNFVPFMKSPEKIEEESQFSINSDNNRVNN